MTTGCPAPNTRGYSFVGFKPNEAAEVARNIARTSRIAWLDALSNGSAALSIGRWVDDLELLTHYRHVQVRLPADALALSGEESPKFVRLLAGKSFRNLGHDGDTRATGTGLKCR